MNEELLMQICEELTRAQKKFPTWPTDPIHAVAVIAEELGELTKALLEFTYEPGKADPEAIERETIQLSAMSLRFAMSLQKYRAEPSKQHSQVEIRE